MGGLEECRRTASAERHTFVCAWCSVLLRASPDPDCATVNYGICPRCLESQLSALARVDGARRTKRHEPSPRKRGKATGGWAEHLADA
jgi:hypothetical protein